MADTDAARLAEIDAELQRRGIAIPGATEAPAAPVATGASPPEVTQEAPALAPATEEGPNLNDAAAQNQSILHGIGNAISAVAGDVYKSLPELPGAVGRGVTGAVKESAGAIKGASGFLASHGVQDPLMVTAGVAAKGWEWLAGQTQDLIPKPETMTGGLVEGATQFVTGMVGLGKVLKVGQGVSMGAKVAESLFVNGAVSGIVFGGHEQRLSDLLEQSPAIAPYVPDFLTSKPGDTEAEGRLKNALEGMIVGPMADAFLWSLKGTKALMSASKATAEGDHAAAAGFKQEAIVATEEAQKAFDAYHGSRHDLTEFKSDKIGTGEGSQMEGHGHYVTETKGVAEFYKKAGQPLDPVDAQSAADAAAQFAETSDPSQLAKWIKTQLGEKDGGLLWDETPQSKALFQQAADALENGAINPTTGGNLYNVKVKADKDAFLLLDEPMSAQKPAVRENLDALLQEHGIPPMADDATGHEYYKTLSDTLGDEAAASKALHDAGIPGNRYLDGNSRDGRRNRDSYADVLPAAEKELTDLQAHLGRAVDEDVKGRLQEDIFQLEKDIERYKGGANGEETYNYVVFSDDALEVTGKNGEPVKAPEMSGGNKATQASSEGIPKDESITAKAGEHDAPAPYAEDLRTGAEAIAPLPAFKLSDVLPKLGKGKAEDAVEALRRRFTMNPEDGGLHPISPDQRFNMDHINSPDTLKAALDAITTVGEDAIKKARVKEVMTFPEITKMADEISDTFGANPSMFMTVLAHDSTTMERMAARMKAYRDFRDDAVASAADYADKALTMAGTPEGVRLQAQALHSANIAMQVSAMTKGIETGTARTLAAQNIASKAAKRAANWDFEALAKQLEGAELHQDDKGLLLILKGLKDNPKGFNKLMEKSVGGKLKDIITQWGMNAMLSSPKTWVANFVSNVAMAGYGPMERAVAGMMPASEVGAGKALMRMKDEYTGMMMGLFDATKVAGTAFKNNISSLDPKHGGKVGENGIAIDALSARGLGLTRDIVAPTGELIKTETTPALSMMMDGINNVVNIPSRMLVGGDELTKQVVYRGFLYSRAAEAARIRQLKGKDFADFVAKRMDEGFADGGNLKAAGAATDKEGLQIAREATFSQDLEYGISRWVQGMSNDSLMARTVVPFVRTPVNIFRFSWKHTPIINFLEEGVRRDWRAGGEAKARVQAQMATGAAMWTMAGGLAMTGIVTGSAPLDPELRKAKEATGWKEYSLKIGEKYYNFNRLDPFATVLGLAADFHDISAHVGQNELDKVAYGMSLALLKNLTSKTYTQGLMNVFNGVNDALSGRSDMGIRTWAYRTAGSWTIPGIVNNGRGELDDSLREVRSFVDAMKARLPGYSKDLPPVRNMLGEAVEGPKAWGPDFLSPIGMTANKNDAVYDELSRSMTVANHPLGRATPQIPGTTMDLREITLGRNGQNAYDRLQEILKDSGVKGKLDKLFASPGYKKAPDGSLDFSAVNGTKLMMTNTILSQHREYARQKILQENPDLFKRFQDETRQRALAGSASANGQHYQPHGLLEGLFGSKSK